LHNVLYIYIFFFITLCFLVLRLKSTEKDKTGRFVMHTIQLKPRLACKTLEVNRIISVTSQSETIQPFAVQVYKKYLY